MHNEHGRLSAGEYRMRFNATGLASGLYIYRLDTGTKVYTNTITLLKQAELHTVYIHRLGTFPIYLTPPSV